MIRRLGVFGTSLSQIQRLLAINRCVGCRHWSGTRERTGLRRVGLGESERWDIRWERHFVGGAVGGVDGRAFVHGTQLLLMLISCPAAKSQPTDDRRKTGIFFKKWGKRRRRRSLRPQNGASIRRTSGFKRSKVGNTVSGCQWVADGGWEASLDAWCPPRWLALGFGAETHHRSHLNEG